MLLPLTDQDVFTSSSRNDYTQIISQHAELPESLEGLFALLASQDKAGMATRGAVLLVLLLAIRRQEPGHGSGQLWLLFAFRWSLKGIAGKYQSRCRSDDETLSEVVWSFLETIHRMDLDGPRPFLTLDLVRESARRARRSFGYDDLEPAPASLSLDELMAGGWDAAQVGADPVDRIRQLPITAEEQFLLIGQYVYGYSQEELSAQLGIGIQALWQRKSRLMRRLRLKKNQE